MNLEEREEKTLYKVIVDHEHQYSIWPADRENALGWNDTGKHGTKQECMDYIREVSAGRQSDSAEEDVDETGGTRGDL